MQQGLQQKFNLIQTLLTSGNEMNSDPFYTTAKETKILICQKSNKEHVIDHLY
jgi:hypothetical protein